MDEHSRNDPGREAAARGDSEAFEAEAQAFLQAGTDVEAVDLLLADINGVLRGKQVPADALGKLADGGVRMPRSSYCLDIFSEDVDAAGLAQAMGDPDGICRPVAGTLAPVPWRGRATAQVLMSMCEADGVTPFYGDPRQVLAGVVQRFEGRGLTPVMASELEFYLIAAETDAAGRPMRPRSPATSDASPDAQIYSMNEVGAFDEVLGAMHRACRAQGVPADATLAEFGPGQYEINLRHVDDALRAGDHAVLMKRAVRGVARAHGFDVTFMAKPYGAHPGNGMHVHLSVLDAQGRNIFSGPERRGSAALRHAIGGLATTAGDCQALFAPHANSYRRFQPGAYAPVNTRWGIDHRGAALRVPVAHGPAARIEHRIAGADANPYLVLAGVLAGVLHGMDGEIDPGPPVEGVAESDDAFTRHWEVAVDAFARSEFIGKYLGAPYRRLFTCCKRQEIAAMASRISDVEYAAYLRQV